jgi:hypothetical protein
MAFFDSVLISSGRSPEISDADDVYGWLVGSWELDVRHYGVDVRERKLKGEVHFARVLEGRAVQDVWIMPRRSERAAAPDRSADMYGLTLRVWDAELRAWRVTWINPVNGQRDELIGRRSGRDIVQVGTHASGTPIRWIFSKIEPGSFLWTGEALAADGQTWTLEGEFHATRL